MDSSGTSSECESAPGPRILLAAANRWSLAARLASGFVGLGCDVAAICPSIGHPISKVRGFNRQYPYAARSPLESLQAAIEDFVPDVIVPLCDRSVRQLHQLHAQC